jgi:predicted nucleic acid-binding Zn ribbon protein
VQHIGKSLKNFLKNSGLEKVIDQQNIIELWGEVVGENISKNAKAKSIEYGVLKVETASSTWRQELYLQKNEIINKLNERIKKKIIKDIRFV